MPQPNPKTNVPIFNICDLHRKIECFPFASPPGKTAEICRFPDGGPRRCQTSAASAAISPSISLSFTRAETLRDTGESAIRRCLRRLTWSSPPGRDFLASVGPSRRAARGCQKRRCAFSVLLLCYVHQNSAPCARVTTAGSRGGREMWPRGSHLPMAVTGPADQPRQPENRVREKS